MESHLSDRLPVLLAVDGSLVDFGLRFLDRSVGFVGTIENHLQDIILPNLILLLLRDRLLHNRSARLLRVHRRCPKFTRRNCHA